MKLTAKIFISLDGVYQGGGGPDEDRRGGFDRGGWVASHSDEEVGSFTGCPDRAALLLLADRDRRRSGPAHRPFAP